VDWILADKNCLFVKSNIQDTGTLQSTVSILIMIGLHLDGAQFGFEGKVITSAAFEVLCARSVDNDGTLGKSNEIK
jgi:hypothetical protein